MLSFSLFETLSKRRLFNPRVEVTVRVVQNLVGVEDWLQENRLIQSLGVTGGGGFSSSKYWQPPFLGDIDSESTGIIHPLTLSSVTDNTH